MAIMAVVHIDDIFTVGLKSRCGRFCDKLNHLVPVRNLVELRWFVGCHYSLDREKGTLTISQQAFADELVRKFQVISEQDVLLRVGVKLEKKILTRGGKLANP